VVRYIVLCLTAVLILSGLHSPAPAAGSQSSPFLQLSVEDLPDSCRLTLSSNSPLRSSVEKNGIYLLVRIRAEQPFRIRRSAFRSRYIESVGWTESVDFYVLNVKLRMSDFEYASSSLSDPPRLIIDVRPDGIDPRPEAAEAAPPVPEKRSGTRAKEREEAAGGVPEPPPAQERAQGYRTIIIDPGHGGLEVGAKGPNGTLEKDITLSISRKLQAIIERNLAYRVVLTRDRDVDVPLEMRAAIANNEHAFLFISIHANGFPGSKARGAETYFLNLNATDEEARRLAYMENNSTELDQIMGDAEDDIKMILWDMAQANYLKQSSQMAELIQSELNTLRDTRNRGVKQAPFKVLTGVACPAVLVEVAFISNPDEERKLLTDDFQNAVADAIYAGLAKYIRQHARD
jgi:N-acetylmuramoyl-L-alanine amidase